MKILRLLTGLEWVVEKIPQSAINMHTYRANNNPIDKRFDSPHAQELLSCHTVGCLAGWMATCPALQKEGFNFSTTTGNFYIAPFYKRTLRHLTEPFCEFFDLTFVESEFLFRDRNSPKKEILTKKVLAIILRTYKIRKKRVPKSVQIRIQRLLDRFHLPMAKIEAVVIR